MQGEQERMRGRIQQTRGSIDQMRGQANQWVGSARSSWGDFLSRFQGMRWGGLSGGMIAFLVAASATTLLLFSGAWSRVETRRQRGPAERFWLWWNDTLGAMGWNR